MRSLRKYTCASVYTGRCVIWSYLYINRVALCIETSVDDTDIAIFTRRISVCPTVQRITFNYMKTCVEKYTPTNASPEEVYLFDLCIEKWVGRIHLIYGTDGISARVR